MHKCWGVMHLALLHLHRNRKGWRLQTTSRPPWLFLLKFAWFGLHVVESMKLLCKRGVLLIVEVSFLVLITSLHEVRGGSFGLDSRLAKRTCPRAWVRMSLHGRFWPSWFVNRWGRREAFVPMNVSERNGQVGCLVSLLRYKGKCRIYFLHCFVYCQKSRSLGKQEAVRGMGPWTHMC